MDEVGEMSAFQELKERELRKFEETYGEEARERYGSEAVDGTNERLMALSQDEWKAKELLEESIKAQLRLAMASGDEAGTDAQELTRMHARWIRTHWGEDAYSERAHAGLAEMYLADERFRAYYDEAAGEGATEFLVRVLRANLEGVS